MYQIEVGVSASFHVSQFSSFDECRNQNSCSLVELLLVSVSLVRIASLVREKGVL